MMIIYISFKFCSMMYHICTDTYKHTHINISNKYLQTYNSELF